MTPERIELDIEAELAYLERFKDSEPSLSYLGLYEVKFREALLRLREIREQDEKLEFYRMLNEVLTELHFAQV